MGEGGDDGASAVVVAEIAEVIDVGTAAELDLAAWPFGGAGAPGAIQHRAGIHHQIVVALVEAVGEPDAQGRQTVALDGGGVAGDDEEFSPGRRRVDDAHQARAGHHGLQAGQFVRPAAAGQYGGNGLPEGVYANPDQLAHRAAKAALATLLHLEADGGEHQQGAELVELVTGEAGATGRARRAHEAVDGQCGALEKFLQELAEVRLLAVNGPAFGGVVGFLGVQGSESAVKVEAARVKAQHFAHQTSARVGQEADLALLRQQARHAQGVLDGAAGQRPVLQCVNALSKMLAQGFPLLGLIGPQPGEAAYGAGGCSVKEDQHRASVRDGGG